MPFRLWDRIRDWVILSVLLLLAIVMMLAQNDPMLRGMRSVSLEVTSWVEARFARVGHFYRALDENEILRRDNIDLSSQLARSREARLENERLRKLLDFRDGSTQTMVAARIIAKNIFGPDNFLLLDVGRADGIEAAMAVVDEKGILGTVILVSDHYSRVMPYLNTDFHVPGKIQPLQAVGIVSWPGSRYDVLVLENVVKTEPVEPGQLVVTSSSSVFFPPGYPIGRVDSVAKRPGENLLEIHLSPASPLNTADHAFVILHKPDPERASLEEAQPFR